MSNARIPARPTLPLDLPATFHGMDDKQRHEATLQAVNQIQHLVGQFELLKRLMDFHDQAKQISGWKAIRLSASHESNFLDVHVQWPGEKEDAWLFLEIGLGSAEDLMEQAKNEECSISREDADSLYQAAEMIFMAPEATIKFVRAAESWTERGITREELENPASLVFPQVKDYIMAWENAFDLDNKVDDPGTPGMRPSPRF